MEVRDHNILILHHKKLLTSLKILNITSYHYHYLVVIMIMISLPMDFGKISSPFHTNATL